MLEARGLKFQVCGDDGGPVAVLDGVDLRVARGEIVDVIGPSGSGKTTLLRALAWLLPGAAGELRLDDEPASAVGAHRWRTKVVLLPQRPAIVSGSVRDNLLLPWRLRVRAGELPPQDARLSTALESLELDVSLERDAAKLSVGQQARVALLRVMLTEPAVLLLDEADAALDEASASAVNRATHTFAASGGAAVRVRHRTDGGVAKRRLRLEGGVLAAVIS